MRSRGPRSDPRQAAARPRRRACRPLAGSRPASSRPRLALLTLALAAALGCAHGGAKPATEPIGDQAPNGVRLLYEARVTEARGEVTRFRLAVAFRPPDQWRLEALGPAGGTRLVIATDGATAVALLVADRRYDRAPATAEGLARWTGLPLGAADLGALLRGLPPCGASVPDRAAGAAPWEIRCALDPGEAFAGGIEATGRRRFQLTRIGPAAPARLDDRLFTPEIPEGFERADLATGLQGDVP
ncbi:MAG TPA: hypothetical protein VMQ62_14760 [Dongiaceae bacterium]|nr:hypothetical protein [Dongiaceae bacterium]